MEDDTQTHLKGLALALMRRGIRCWIATDTPGSPSLHFEPDYGSNTITCASGVFLFRIPGGYEEWRVYRCEDASSLAAAIEELAK